MVSVDVFKPLKEPHPNVFTMCPLDESFEIMKCLVFSLSLNTCKHRYNIIPIQPIEFEACKSDTRTLFSLQLICPSEHRRN
jgi:hypothetical protein